MSDLVESSTVEPKRKIPFSSKKLQIAVRLPRTLFNDFKEYVEATGLSQTDVIVTALAKHLDSAEGVPMLHRILELEKRVEALENKN